MRGVFTSAERPPDVQGLRDLLPEEAEALRATQEALLGELRRWGYRFVVTPTLESLDVLERGLGPEQRRRLFKLSDSDGSILALVGERTVPVARLVAGKMRSRPLPLRLCYAGPVLTSEAGRFIRMRESHQVGAELIGAGGAPADAEMIALAVRALDACGLRRYQLDVGHVGFFIGLLEGLQVSDQIRSEIRGALQGRDLVRLEALLDATPLRSAEHELLLRFPALRGGLEILDAAAALVQNRRSERALEELRTVLDLIRAHGLQDSVNVDLGAIRDFEYYSGVVFQGYLPELGQALAQGGRYDGLLARFGRPAPATGFVLNLDLVAEAMRPTLGGTARPALDAAVAWAQGGLPPALKCGLSLRLFGIRTVVDTEPRGLAAARQWAAGLGARDLVRVSGEEDAMWFREGRRGRRLPLAQVVGRLAGRDG